MTKEEKIVNIFEYHKVSIKEESLSWYEKAGISKKLFLYCLNAIPHIFLQSTKKSWGEAIKRRNQQN